MIDWTETQVLSGVSSIEQCRIRKTKLVIRCDICNESRIVVFRSKFRQNQNVICVRCKHKDQEYLNKLSVASNQLWQNSEYISKNLSAVRSPENIAKLKSKTGRIASENQRRLASVKAQKQWESQQFRDLVVTSSVTNWKNPILRQQMLNSIQTEEYRENQRIKAKARWCDPIYQNKQSAYNHLRSAERLAEIRRSQRKVSNLQNILYSVLDDFKIQYYREYDDKEDDKECTIGPYSFDCVIPRLGKPTLLIECQGEYWHNLDRHISRDAAKATYVAKYFQNIYELRCLFESEFKQRRKIVEIIGQLVDGQIDIIDFDFSELSIREPLAIDYRLLLSKYHYLHTAGRGGIIYGVYYLEQLIAVAVFSPPIRQNRDAKASRELSRFCIHPAYQKKNLASWFIGKCLKLLPSQYKTIWAFSDSTVGHDGIIYKASNFELDGIVEPDYWYVSHDNWVMHKKTLYNHAIKMHMTEKEYAKKHQYCKIWGLQKNRYRYDR